MQINYIHQNFEKEYPFFSASKILYLEHGAVSMRSKKVLDLEELGCRLTTTSHQNFEKEYPFFLLQKYCTWNMGQ